MVALSCVATIALVTACILASEWISRPAGAPGRYSVFLAALLFAASIPAFSAAWLLKKSIVAHLTKIVTEAELITRKVNSAGTESKPAGDEFELVSQAFERMRDSIQKNESSLRAGNDSFCELFENTPGASFILKNGKITRANRTALQLFHDTEKEILGGSPGAFSPRLQPEGRESTVEWDKRVQAAFEGAPQIFEWVHRRRDGTEFSAEICLSRMDVLGDPCIQVALRDVTGRKAAEVLLRESEEKYRRLFETANDAIILTDAEEGRILDANVRAAQLIGRPVEGIVGLPHSVLYPPEEENSYRRLIQATLQDGNSRLPEFLLRNAGGTEIPVDVSASAFRVGSRRVILGLYRDNRERRLAEEALQKSELQFREVMETLNLVAVMLDMEGRVQFCNEYACKITGWTHEELLGQNWFDVVLAEKERKKAALLLRRLASHSEIPAHTRSTLLTRKGECRLVVWDNAVLRDSEGRPAGIASIGRDITGEMELEKRLRQAQKVEAIGTLAGGIAHDFNNILGPILGYSELAMLSLKDDDPVLGYQKQIFTAANRAKALVRQILSIGKPQEEDKQPVELQSIVKEVVHLLREIVPSSIQIKHYTSPLCGTVLADPGQVHQVLMNLCTNAVHAMRDQQGVLEIRLEPTTVGQDLETRVPGLRAGPHVRLEVSDNGHGMDTSTLERIFDPYFTTKEPSHGTGLGLAVVHSIISRCEGAITVQSHPGMGTTFQIYFPIFGEAQTASANVLQRAMGGKGRILLVDDEPALVELGRMMLQRLGYEVQARTNSVEALALLKKNAHEFDLVITDQTMPVLTGLNLAKEILSIHPDLPFILCTGYSEMVDRSTVTEAGFREFVSKPYTMRDLADAVHRAIRKTA